MHKDTYKETSKRHLCLGTLSGRLIYRAVRPVLAGLEQMVTLLKQTSSQVAGKQGAAVLVNAVAEVLTGDADVVPLPVLKVFVFDVAPLLHEPNSKYICTSRGRVTGSLAVPSGLASASASSLVSMQVSA